MGLARTQSFQLIVLLRLASTQVISTTGALGTRDDSVIPALFPLGLERPRVISAPGGDLKTGRVGEGVRLAVIVITTAVAAVLGRDASPPQLPMARLPHQQTYFMLLCPQLAGLGVLSLLVRTYGYWYSYLILTCLLYTSPSPRD